MATPDWAAAAETLYRAAREQFTRFLAGPVREQVYAVGFFFDPVAGDVYPVANTMDHHLRSFKALVDEYGPTDQQEYLWNSGNWEYPAGLFPSASQEFKVYDDAWAPHREAVQAVSVEADDAGIARLDSDLRRLCVGVLRRLAADGYFAGCPHLMGYVVQSPFDESSDLASQQAQVTAAVTGQQDGDPDGPG